MKAEDNNLGIDSEYRSTDQSSLGDGKGARRRVDGLSDNYDIQRSKPRYLHDHVGRSKSGDSNLWCDQAAGDLVILTYSSITFTS